ncbi:hypothetical protein N9571_06030 [Yoonia sp.]|uniref:hypothetical protein n=1 Tax=Yoonia sp. TaxID=2212373 RepID=UPI002370AA24|nr:hypothetical protein [Yoonia sp.]MDB4112093.1 hypothetical protein [Yoonia sp.]
MILPIDLSDEPPLRDINIPNVTTEFGEISSMKPNEATDVLYELTNYYWLEHDDSGEVFKLLILRAEIQHDLDELENLGLGQYFVKK